MDFFDPREIKVLKRNQKLATMVAVTVPASVAKAGRDDGFSERLFDIELHDPTMRPFVPFFGLEKCILLGPREHQGTPKGGLRKRDRAPLTANVRDDDGIARNFEYRQH